MSSNDAIKTMLGTASADTKMANTKSNPSLKSISTNGALLNQNLSALATKIGNLSKKWGA